MAFWLRIGGIILGALSLFKLGQRLFEFQLTSVFWDLLAFYQQFFNPLSELVNIGISLAVSWLGFQIPRIPDEVVVLYLLFGASFSRALILPRPQYPFRFDLILAIVQVPLWPIWLIFHMHDYLSMGDPPIALEDVSAWARQMLAVVGAFFVLFALNAYGVSL